MRKRKTLADLILEQQEMESRRKSSKGWVQALKREADQRTCNETAQVPPSAPKMGGMQ